MSPTNETKTRIEATIDSARNGVAERVEAIDRKIRGDVERLRDDLDVSRLAAENAPQLVAAGVATGIVLGYGLPKPLLRIVQIAAAVGIATVVATRIRESLESACGIEEITEAGAPYADGMPTAD